MNRREGGSQVNMPITRPYDLCIDPEEQQPGVVLQVADAIVLPRFGICLHSLA